MTGFLKYVLGNLVEHPDAIQIAREDTDKEILCTLTLHPDDIGRVIGRHGRTIGAVRTLANTLASKQGKRAVINVNDPAGTAAEHATEPTGDPAPQ